MNAYVRTSVTYCPNFAFENVLSLQYYLFVSWVAKQHDAPSTKDCDVKYKSDGGDRRKFWKEPP